MAHLCLMAVTTVLIYLLQHLINLWFMRGGMIRKLIWYSSISISKVVLYTHFLHQFLHGNILQMTIQKNYKWMLINNKNSLLRDRLQRKSKSLLFSVFRNENCDCIYDFFKTSSFIFFLWKFSFILRKTVFCSLSGRANVPDPRPRDTCLIVFISLTSTQSKESKENYS